MWEGLYGFANGLMASRVARFGGEPQVAPTRWRSAARARQSVAGTR